MVTDKTTEMISEMRKGNKVKCPKCDGYISAIGKPKETSLFRCDGCGTSMILTKARYKI